MSLSLVQTVARALRQYGVLNQASAEDLARAAVGAVYAWNGYKPFNRLPDPLPSAIDEGESEYKSPAKALDAALTRLLPDFLSVNHREQVAERLAEALAHNNQLRRPERVRPEPVRPTLRGWDPAKPGDDRSDVLAFAFHHGTSQPERILDLTELRKAISHTAAILSDLSLGDGADALNVHLRALLALELEALKPPALFIGHFAPGPAF